MKHLKYFDNKQDYTSFFSPSDFIRPNVSFTEDSDITYFNPVIKPWDIAGSVVLYDNVNNKQVFVYQEKLTADKYPSSRYTPIGVVVIPKFHDVYGTNQCGVMSINGMDNETPNTGNMNKASEQPCGSWSGKNLLVEDLPTWTQVPLLGKYSSSNTLMYIESNTCYMPMPGLTGFKPSAGYGSDTNVGYQSSPGTPSPYLENGDRNPIYYCNDGRMLTDKDTSTKVALESNVLSDFNGKENTEIILTHATGQSDWRTASTIKSYQSAGYYVAACCTWRYYTKGTQQGDWYLPAMGELGYMLARYSVIEDSLEKIQSIYNYGNVFGSSTSYRYLSSSQRDAENVWTVTGWRGIAYYLYKYNSHYVRAFTRI